jgi:hypothetical protein
LLKLRLSAEYPNLTFYLPEQDRQAGAVRLQELGVTPIGAQQAMHGQIVTNIRARSIIAALLHRATATRGTR